MDCKTCVGEQEAEIYNLMLDYCQGWLEVERKINFCSRVYVTHSLVFLEDMKYAIIKNEYEGARADVRSWKKNKFFEINLFFRFCENISRRLRAQIESRTRTRIAKTERKLPRRFEVTKWMDLKMKWIECTELSWVKFFSSWNANGKAIYHDILKTVNIAWVEWRNYTRKILIFLPATIIVIINNVSYRLHRLHFHHVLTYAWDKDFLTLPTLRLFIPHFSSLLLFFSCLSTDDLWDFLLLGVSTPFVERIERNKLKNAIQADWKMKANCTTLMEKLFRVIADSREVEKCDCCVAHKARRVAEKCEKSLRLIWRYHRGYHNTIKNSFSTRFHSRF